MVLRCSSQLGWGEPGPALQPVVLVALVVVVSSTVRTEFEVLIIGCAAKPQRCSRIVCDPAIGSVPPFVDPVALLSALCPSSLTLSPSLL